MVLSLVKTQPSVSPRAAVLQAKELVREYRFFEKNEPGLEFPSPKAEEEAAYRILRELNLLHPNSFRWTTRGRRVLALSYSKYNAVFDHHLSKLMRANTVNVVKAILEWQSTQSKSRRPEPSGANAPGDEETAAPESAVFGTYAVVGGAKTTESDNS